MTEAIHTRAVHFMIAVQAGVVGLASAIRRADSERKLAHQYSGSGVFIIMDEAVRASGIIPEDMSPSEAAKSFVQFWAERDKRSRSASWFLRYGNERHSYDHLTKAEQFLWIVQTSIICDQENQASYDSMGENSKLYSAESVISAVSAAVEVSQRIPADLNSTEAASDFCSYHVLGMRERKRPPKWCLPRA